MYIARFQDATYWGTPVPNGVGGWTFAAPVALKVRWEEHIEQVIDSEGNDFTSTAQVMSTANLALGGYLLLGTSVASDPTSIAGARPIVKVDNIPDIRAIRQNNKAYL